jgi:DNA-binding GntR family transcriptional regulator
MARLTELREVLEGLAARRAATRISREEVDRIDAKFRARDLTDDGPAKERYMHEWLDHFADVEDREKIQLKSAQSNRIR